MYACVRAGVCVCVCVCVSVNKINLIRERGEVGRDKPCTRTSFKWPKGGLLSKTLLFITSSEIYVTDNLQFGNDNSGFGFRPF